MVAALKYPATVANPGGKPLSDSVEMLGPIVPVCSVRLVGLEYGLIISATFVGLVRGVKYGSLSSSHTTNVIHSLKGVVAHVVKGLPWCWVIGV